MSQRAKAPPTSWDVYERGRTSSFGSLESVPENSQADLLSSSAGLAGSSGRAVDSNSDYDEDGNPYLRRRRSSFTMRLNSIRQAGGPNSIDNFARSYQRAAGFREITPVRRNSISVEDEEQDPSSIPSTESPSSHKSLLRQQLENAGRYTNNEIAVQEQPSEHGPPTEESSLLPASSRPSHLSLSSSLLHSQRQTSLGASYGSISSRLTETARQRASILIQEQYEASIRALQDPESEYKEQEERPVEREIRPDGEIIERTVGESTVPMTIFNSTNVLVGVGILALPLAVKYSGWIIGLLLLTLAALVTSYTAKLLAKCLDTNTGATTYGDIAFLAFDSWGRNVVESLFILELTAANVALLILFADSMNSLIPALSVFEWKLLASCGLIPLNFVSFRYLSFTSIIGIFSCVGIIVIVLTDGFMKPHAPGSLREVAKTYAFPQNWKTVPLSLGLFMAPWGGHSVFPAIYKDMRHPQKYGRAVKYTYGLTYSLDISMAVLGYLMFGNEVFDEVTSNILLSSSRSYPRALSILIVTLIAVIPITKIPLSNRPMMDTLNKKFYIDLRQMDPKARKRSEASWKHRSARASIAILANVVQLGISVVFPDFDSIMALMGSALCFTICVILPVAFHLKIFSTQGKEIGLSERIVDWSLIVVSVLLSILGTVFAVIPKDQLGLE